MEREEKGTWIEVMGRVVPASANSAAAVVAIDAAQIGDGVIYDYRTYLVEDTGFGTDLREMRNDIIIAGGYLHELPSGDPLLRISHFQKW